MVKKSLIRKWYPTNMKSYQVSEDGIFRKIAPLDGRVVANNVPRPEGCYRTSDKAIKKRLHKIRFHEMDIRHLFTITQYAELMNVDRAEVYAQMKLRGRSFFIVKFSGKPFIYDEQFKNEDIKIINRLE